MTCIQIIDIRCLERSDVNEDVTAQINDLDMDIRKEVLPGGVLVSGGGEGVVVHGNNMLRISYLRLF